MRLADCEGKSVGVWGYGREGRANVRAVERFAPSACISVLNDETLSASDQREISGKQLFTGTAIAVALQNLDVVIKSPGISYYRPEISAAKRRGVVFTSGTSLGLSEIDRSRVVGVTGTKGKSTTGALLAHFLRAAGKEVELVGNIGRPLLESILDGGLVDYRVLELSSYQLADLDIFPEFAVLTNIYADHANWHGSTERYQRDKFRLISESGATCFLNAADPLTRSYARELSQTPIWYNQDAGIHIHEEHFHLAAEKLFPVSPRRLLGQHNLSNACAALAVLQRLSFNPSGMENAFAHFSGLPHRLAVIGEKDGVMYVDDSISTVPETALAALKCFPGRPITLLIGGMNRGQDWKSFAEKIVSAPPFAFVTMPENGKEIESALLEHGIPESRLEAASSLQQAVEIARRITPENGVVLLSPAAASYTHFKNFEERGDAFAKFAGLGPTVSRKGGE